MKKAITILSLLAVVSLSSCKKEEIVKGCTNSSADNYNPDATNDDGSCEYTGSVIFWMSSGDYNVDVTVNGATSTISSNYSSTPECGSSGCASFTLSSGTYSYHAEEDALFPTTWAGNITVPKGGCQTLKLVY